MDCVKINLGSTFLLNAGIVGFIKLLHAAGTENGRDYTIEEQTLLVDRAFFEKQDLAKLFVKTMVSNFRDQTKYLDVLNKQGIVESLYENYEAVDKDTARKINEIYNELIKMLEKKSFMAGYAILKESGLDIDFLGLISEFKAEKDMLRKKQLYFNLCGLLERDDVSEILIFKELLYTKISLFYGNTSFFLKENLKKSITECYRKDFVEPLLAHLNAEKPGKKRCIECYGMSVDTRSISFMLDTADDVARKKSYYWNQKPDAFICPLCAFLYTLVPLGFEFLGEDAVFINNNNDIKQLYMLMNTYREMKDEEKGSFKSRLFGAFTAQKVDMLGNKTSNIQVVVRSRRKSHFQFNIIDADMVRKLQKGVKYLERLERKYVKDKGKYVNDKENYIAVYDEVLDNFLLKRSQYGLINRLMKIHLSDNTDCSYIMNILRLEIIFKGGDDMEAIKKNADSAWRSGKEMRNLFTREVSEEDMDNSLRCFVYRLTNALSVGNRDDFLDSIIRIYSGKGLPIPYVFRECMESEDMFRAIGYGYILGLKYSPYESKDKKEEKNDD